MPVGSFMTPDGGFQTTTPYKPPMTPTTTNTQSPPPPALPPPAAGGYDSNIPGVANYMGADAQALKAYNDALTSINYNRQQLLSQNGYVGDVDPKTGAINNLRVDPYNRFGGLQQMLNSQANEDIGASNDAAGRGLHGGLAHQPEAALRYAHGAADQSFGQQLFSNMHNLDDSQTGAFNTYNNTLWQDQMNAALAAIMNQQFNPADPGSSGGGNDPFTGSIPGAAAYASGAQADPFANLSNLTAADWAKLAKASPTPTTTKAYTPYQHSPGVKKRR